MDRRKIQRIIPEYEEYGKYDECCGKIYYKFRTKLKFPSNFICKVANLPEQFKNQGLSM